MPRDPNDDIDDLIKRAKRISGEPNTNRSDSQVPTEDTPAESNTPETVNTTKEEAAGANPMQTLEEFQDNVTWFNKRMRWVRNAFNRVSGAGGRVADIGMVVWNHGLGQVCRFGWRNSVRAGKAYAKVFNWASHKKDPATGDKKFSKFRATFAVAATAGAAVGAYYAVPLAINPAYDATMRLTTERTEVLYLYNPEPIPGREYAWFVNASDSPERTSKNVEKMVIDRNAAYWRWSEDTENLAGAITEEPEPFHTTTTGFRIRLPGGLIDIHKEIQAVRPAQIPPVEIQID